MADTVPGISIIIPIYKVEQFLPRSLDSILSQSFQDWELILVDDGSPDRCGKICDAYAKKDKRIHVIHQVNGGVSAARNAGMDMARGEYLYFVDSDDYLAPDALQVMYDLAMAKQADIVMAGHYRVKANGKITGEGDSWIISDATAKIQSDILRNKLPNFAWGKLYKRSLWEDVSFPTGVLLMEDMYVVADVFYKAKKIVYTSRPLYYYSQENAGSITSAGGNKYIQARFGKFLGWKAHEVLADRYKSPYTAECACQAVHSAVRAYSLDYGSNILSNSDKAEIIAYLKTHRDLPVPFGISLVRWLILRQWNSVLTILGKTQRQLLARQQKQRQRKWEKSSFGHLS